MFDRIFDAESQWVAGCSSAWSRRKRIKKVSRGSVAEISLGEIQETSKGLTVPESLSQGPLE